MKYLNLFMFFTSLLVVVPACQQKVQDNEQTTAAASDLDETVNTVEASYYGEKITGEGAIPSEALLSALEGKDSLQVKLSSKILSTCQMKGCWMKVDLAGDSDMRVTFKDYGFFVPKEGMEGKEAIIEGYAKQIETDVATLKHYARDAGKSQAEIDAITEPKREVTFVASGVIIK